ncbi:MAG: NADH:ubiquinone oxidoreductase subunit NDUFA12 [Aestuariivirgaceae bacterium]
MLNFLKQFFTWWNGQTLGLRWYTARKGEFVGEDEFGNKYYRAPSAVPDSIAERRWVVYNGYAEASSIPPGWHGWMHHTVDTPPSKTDYAAHEWQQPHQANPTGTGLAYRPPGSIVGGAPKTTASEPDYEAWQPE